jgi:uncharacterized protein
METTLDEYVQTALKDDHSGHGYDHAKRVRSLARRLQKEEGGDLKIIETAALVHDTIDSKLFADIQKQIALLKDELASLGFSEKDIQTILDIITHVSWHLHDESPKSVEAKIVIDSDRLEALGAIGLVRTIEYGAAHQRAFYREENLLRKDGKVTFLKSTETTLSHFYDKLLTLEGTFYTPTAEKLAHERTEFLKTFLAEFYQELSD